MIIVTTPYITIFKSIYNFIDYESFCALNKRNVGYKIKANSYLCQELF